MFKALGTEISQIIIYRLETKCHIIRQALLCKQIKNFESLTVSQVLEDVEVDRKLLVGIFCEMHGNSRLFINMKIRQIIHEAETLMKIQR